MRPRFKKTGKTLKVPRTLGAQATVRAFSSRQMAINSFAEAMKHLQDLGAVPTVTESRLVDFKDMVERFWTTRLVQLRKEHGAEDVDEAVKLIEQWLKENTKRY